jgi:hypothetical protein
VRLPRFRIRTLVIAVAALAITLGGVLVFARTYLEAAYERRAVIFLRGASIARANAWDWILIAERATDPVAAGTARKNARFP